MNVNMEVKAGLRLRAFYLFFIISSAQTSVGIMGIPKFIFNEAHQDSWLAILIAYVYMLMIVVIMFLILEKYENADIFGIQYDIFGKWFGKILGTIYIFYFMLSLLSILITYIQVIKIFIYPHLPSYIMGLLLLSLVVYSVLGGIRIIVGVIFIFFFLSFWILFFLYDPIYRMQITHFQPMFITSMIDLLKGARATSYAFLGVESIFIIYPFIENKEKAKLFTILGMSYTTIIVLLGTMISIGYFSPRELEKTNWAVLKLFRGISLPLIERLDYIIIVEWMMVTIPTMLLLMWAITYGAKRLFAIRQKTTIYTVAIFLLAICSFIKYEYTIEKIGYITDRFGFWLVFVYPIVLLPIVFIKKKWQKVKGRAKL